MFEITAVDVSEQHDAGADLHLRHPDTGKPLFDKDGKPVTIRLAGPDSKRFQDAERWITDRQMQANKGKRNFTLTADDIDEYEIERLARCTIAWSPMTQRGEPFACTPENARALYRSNLALRRQVKEFIEERGNFSKT